MQLSLDKLLIFVTATQEPSFAATARRLGRVPSVISNAISDLEIDLGVTLFDRSSRYPVLTSVGKTLLTEAEAVLSHCQSIIEQVQTLSAGHDTNLSIGIEDAFPYGILSPLLNRMHQRFAGLQIDFLQPGTDELLDLVLNDKAMLGLGTARAHYPPGIGFCRLGQAAFAVVVHRSHPLAGQGHVRLVQLADHLQLGLKSQTNHLLTVEYIKSPRSWVVQSQLALLEMLKNGLGWAILPKRLVSSELAAGELVELKLDAFPYTEWSVGLDMIWKVESRLGAAAAWLKTELMQTAVFS
jgi:DNA-binding transcriptional LysR family regulator